MNQKTVDLILNQSDSAVYEELVRQKPNLVDKLLDQVREIFQLENLARLVFSEEGNEYCSQPLKQRVLEKFFDVNLDKTTTAMADLVQFARYASNPYEGVKEELVPGISVVKRFGLGNKKIACDILSELRTLVLEEQFYNAGDLMPLMEYANEADGLGDHAKAIDIVRDCIKLIKKRGLGESSCSILVEYVSDPENGFGDSDLGKKLILVMLDALADSSEYRSYDFMPLADMAFRENRVGDPDLARIVIEKAVAKLLHPSVSFFRTNDLTQLARFALKGLQDERLCRRIVTSGIEYFLENNGMSMNVIDLAKFSINTSTLNDHSLGLEMIQRWLDSNRNGPFACSLWETIQMAEFAANTNKYNGLNDKALTRDIISKAIAVAVEKDWPVSEFISLARSALNLREDELARTAIVHCFDILMSKDGSQERDYEELAQFAIDSLGGSLGEAMAKSILDRTLQFND